MTGDVAGSSPADTWICPAYGPEGRSIGAICFFPDLYARTCLDEETCHRSLQAERVRIFEQLHQLAAAGDETLRGVAASFTSPDQLLGGPQVPRD